MKKFCYYACGISAIIVAICAVVVTVHTFNNDKKFNVKIEGRRNYSTYTITGTMPADQVAPFVKKKTDEIREK